MTIPAHRIAEQISGLSRRLESVERGPQLDHSSVVIDGEDVLVADGLAAGLRAEVTAGLAIDAASSAEAKADGAVVTFYGDAADRTNAKVGDFWVNDAGNTSIYNGSAWEPVTSTEVATALAAAQSAEAAVDGKVTTFFSTTPPTAEAVGDLWFDTDDGNRLYRWSGTAWDNAQDASIAAAKVAAADAQAKADSALVSANDARAIADGKVRTFFQATEPTGLVAGDEGDLWFDTDDANRMYRWSGTAWVLSADTRISQALTDAAAASTAAGQAQSTANTKITTYYQTAPPTGSLTTGDLWVDTDDGNRLYRWNGSSWVDVESTRIAAAQAAANTAQNRADTALSTAQTAQTTADGKAVTYFQGTAPTGLTANDVGDLWFNTADKNKMSRWSGTAWVLSQDQTIAEAQTAAQNAQTAAGNAQSTADKKTTTWYAAAAPTTGLTVGDLWVNTADKNRMYRWNGSSWVDIRDTAITDAQNTANTANGTANTALTTANGKGKAWFQDTQPTASSEFDIWFKTNEDHRPYKRVNGAWVGASFADGALGAINVGKLVAGKLSAQYVQITGRLTTAPDGVLTGARVEYDANGIRAYNSAGTLTVNIKSDGTASFTGTVTGSTVVGSNIQTATSGNRVELGPSFDGGAGLRIYEGGDPNPTFRARVQYHGGTSRSVYLHGPFDNLSYVHYEMYSNGEHVFWGADVNGGNSGDLFRIAPNSVYSYRPLAVTGRVSATNFLAKGQVINGWGRSTAAIQTDTSGFATISHTLGFTPTFVIAKQRVTSGVAIYQYLTDSYTSSSFRVRALTASGGGLTAATNIDIEWAAWG